MLTPSAAQQHIRIAALLTLASGVIALLPAILVVLIAAGFLTAGAFGMGAGSGSEGPFPGLMVGGIMGLVAIVLAVVSIPAIIAGFGLMARKPWARVLTILLGIINLFGFPIGTMLGAYQLWVLAVNQETRAAYEGGAAAPDAARAGAHRSY